jgi:hypothetical protein
MTARAKTVFQFAAVGIVFAVAAFLSSAFVLATVQSGDWLILLATAPLSAFFIALICWALITAGGRKISVWRGAGTGALAGSISHFFAWYLAIVWFYLRDTVAADGSPTVGLSDGFFAGFVMSFFSLALTGWLTIPAGMIVGALFAMLWRRYFLSPVNQQSQISV